MWQLRTFRLAAAFALAVAMPVWAPAQVVTEMRVVNESAPGGGVAVVVIELTEPHPIITGRFSFSFSGGPLRQVRGIGLFSSQLDVVGAARLSSNQVNVRFASFSGNVGGTPDLPIGVIALDVASSATEGATGSFTVDNVEIISPGGQPYTNSIKQGSFTVGGLSISSVTPASGTVSAGQTIMLNGVGFDTDAEVRIEDVSLGSTQVISASELRVTAQQQFLIDGQEISVRNKDAGEEDDFYVYQPAAKLSTTQHGYLGDVVPIFDQTVLTRGLLRNVASGGTKVTGVALLNPGSSTASVEIEVLDASQGLLGMKSLNLGASQRALFEVSDMVAQPTTVSGGFLVVRSTSPIGMLGLVGNTSDDSLTPIILEDDQLPDPGPGPTTPVISQAGIVLATLLPAQPTGAARALVSLFGTGFAAANTQASVGQSDVTTGGILPTKLGGVCVTFNGVRGYLLFASASQVNVQVPDVPLLGPVPVKVIRDCDSNEAAESQAVNFMLEPAAPGFFLFGNDPASNPAAALHGSGPELVGDPPEVANAQPAQPGEIISLFGTGLGATSGALAAGVVPVLAGAIDVDALRTVDTVSVTIGGIPVPAEDIFFAGAAPCCSGLDQVTVRVPAAAPNGKLPIVLSINGRSTAAGVYISVAAAQ